MSAEALKTSIAGPADNGPSDTRAGKWSIGTNGRNCIEKRCHPTKYISAHYNILCTCTSSHPISTCLMVGFALTCSCPNKYLLALPPNSFPPSLLALRTTKRYSNQMCFVHCPLSFVHGTNTIEQGSSIHLEKIFSSVIALGLTGH